MRYKNIKVTLNFNIKEVLKFGYSLNDNVITFRMIEAKITLISRTIILIVIIFIILLFI